MTRRTQPFSKVGLVFAGIVLSCGLAGVVSAQAGPASVPPILFSDNMESGTANWTVSHEVVGGASCPTDEWHLGTSDSHSATHAWTNDPYAPAMNGLVGTACVNYLTSRAITTVSGVSRLRLTFWEHHFTEGGTVCNPPTNDPPLCDYGVVQVSGDGGTNWTDVSPVYDQGSPTDSYAQRSVDILAPAFTPGNPIQLRFKFNSDYTNASPPNGPFTGWFVDDVVLSLQPTAVGVKSFSARRGR